MLSLSPHGNWELVGSDPSHANVPSLFQKPYLSNVKDVMKTATDILFFFKFIWFNDNCQPSRHKSTWIHWNFAFGKCAYFKALLNLES